MLAELIISLTTSCPPYVRHMDYLHEIIAMRQRSRRNRDAWQPHLERSRGCILSAAEKCEQRGAIVILGAGLLLDVPVEELARMFHEVRLIDIVLLPEVRRRVRRYPNVSLIQHDIAKVSGQLYENLNRGSTELPESRPDIPAIDGKTGLVVSLNILSQLWVMPRAYVLRKAKGIDQELVDGWCGTIVDAHCAALRALPCRVCLIADHEFIKRDRAGTIIGEGSTIYGRKLPQPEKAWTWDIAPPGEDQRHVSRELLVGSWTWGGDIPISSSAG